MRSHNLKSSVILRALIFSAMAFYFSSCELGVKEEPQPQSEIGSVTNAPQAFGGGITIPLGWEITSFVNINWQYNVFYLLHGDYISHGDITRSGVVITRLGSSVPKVRGWMGITGSNVLVSYLTWDGSTWTGGHGSVFSPTFRNLVSIKGQNVTFEYNKFKNITTLENYTLIRAGGEESGNIQNSYNVSNIKIQYNEIDNWKHVGSQYLYGIFLGHFDIDVPEATGGHIRWNVIKNGPTTFSNPAITIADGDFDHLTGYNPLGNQAVNIEGNLVQDGFDAFSIKVNNATIRYNVVNNSTSSSSPGIQNRFGSNNIFEGNLVTGATNGAGIMIWSGNNLTFRNNIVRDCMMGIWFRSNSTGGSGGDHILLTNNTFVRNADNVVFFNESGATYAHDDVVFINNIFYKKNSSMNGPFISDPQGPSFNIWNSISYMGYDLFANGFSAPSGCNSCLSPGGAVFDHVGTNNFDIENGSSPAINAGTNWSNGMPLEDFERKIRPVSIYDIGAFEKNGY